MPLSMNRTIRSLAVIAILGLTQGCYLARAAIEEARILAARRPIAELIDEPGLDDSTRRKLRLVVAARRFAADSLGLDPGKSFTAFSDIGRDTLVLVLSAARRDSLAGHTWRYPVVGKLPYRGFFELSDALDARRDLEAKGYDTYLRTSDAFSTLGWFDDPLLSTTLRHDSLSLVNTVIHEITHSTFFPKGQAIFNESFASFVGARGAERFFRSRGSEEAAAMTDASWRDQKVLSAFWGSLSRSLDSAFSAHPGSRERRLLARDTVYARARAALKDSVGAQLRTIGPWYADRVPLNNAYVLARVVYAKELAMFDDVYWAEDRDLRATIATVLRLVKTSPSDPFGAISAWITAARQPASTARPAMNPARVPEKFSGGVISDDNEQWRITFTRDGKTAYFAESPEFFPRSRRATIFMSRLVNGSWTTPEVAPFSGRHSDIDPFITPDGRLLYFSSIRPVDGVTRGDIDIWMVELRSGGWSDPIHLGPEVNTSADELYPSASSDGTLYFASGPRAPEAGAHYDIYHAKRRGAGFSPRVALSSGVNTVPMLSGGVQDAWEFNPEISADGRMLIFTSLRPGGFGLGDLYVSRFERGVWTPARNLGPAVNTAADEYHPTLSRDRKHLYFVRRIPAPGDFYRVATGALGIF